MRRRKSLIIACAVMVIAAAGMSALYVGQRNKQQEQEKIAQLESEREAQSAKREEEKKREAEQETEEAVADVNSIINPNQATIEGKPGAATEEVTELETEAGANADSEAENVKEVSKNTASVHFSEESTMNWPLQGNVILNYSMDQTVYYATLDQYKYNPAVIIAGAVNDRISAAATGIVTDISTNETTGCTVTMDLGDGYSAIYGQLKSVPYEVGDTVVQGKLVGYIAEPTKYYSVEGSNLYFAMEKDGEPVNPVTYFE